MRQISFDIRYLLRTITLPLLFLSDHHLTDRIAHGRKLLLILRHHISLHQLLIMMKIKRTNLQVPVRLLHLFQENSNNPRLSVLNSTVPSFSGPAHTSLKTLWKSVFSWHDGPSATDRKNSDKSRQPHPSQNLRQKPCIHTDEHQI